MERGKFFDHESIWWRGKVKVESNSIIPVKDQLTRYNPFDLYYPQDSHSREQRSLPYIFLDVDAQSVDAIAGFCKRFGVLGARKNEGWGKWPRFPPTRRLCVSMKVREFQSAQKELQKTIEMIIEASNNPSSNNDSVRLSLSLRLRNKFSKVRPFLGWDQQEVQWFTGWDIGSLEAVMYLMLLFDIQGQGRIRACESCNKSFLGGHSRTRFCSLRCQNGDKVRRFRERQSANKNKHHKGPSRIKEKV